MEFEQTPVRPEPFWPAILAVLSAILLQFTLPERLTVGPTWLIPSLETLLLIGLSLSTPMQLTKEHPRRRMIALGLTGFVSAANIASLALLTHFLLHHGSPNGRELIVSGAEIWITNVIIFGLWYWQTDRGGPGRRATGNEDEPDLLFPQMSTPEYGGSEWRPGFVDYTYVSFTNATAFSPTDTMPLTPLAKSIMGVQALVSLVTIGLIVSRAVNILG